MNNLTPMIIVMTMVMSVGLVTGDNRDTAQKFGCPHDQVFGHCRWIETNDNGFIKWYVASAPRYGPGYSCRSIDTAYCCDDKKETHAILGNGIKARNDVADFVNGNQCVAAKTR
ncbi:uncharacterized protein PGTG_10962 [Puccinia graminis f. sp. tritici CRL 75-36-700-3]|uniref:Uncharacterized protein n=1 Tax=Puccinia graminis f. sp. tritici (strain CRL 75-36-700-3 / race SCCL) TaxID=418459 RepID=E3KMZ7_PUCGT|nr:uncharacterized protein PGTG_10962 [Puccinia graminis f. sp. tritici CRL 75-36-700-3]EFP85633.1 hypothetical protein PGTG_10962 [Puccinia graminis f. sp. tritici CRL 75-36-700-3]